MSVEIRPLTDEDMRRLAKRLRPMDLLEVRSAFPDGSLDDILVEASGKSLRARAGYFDGDLVACWGVSPQVESSSEASPWLLATDAMERPEVRRAFLAHGSEEMQRLVADFKYLWNFVHRENVLARRWLRFMGFEFRDQQEYLISGEPFVRFEMGAA